MKRSQIAFACGARTGVFSCAGYLTHPRGSHVLKSPKCGIMLWNRQSIWSQSPHDDKHPPFLWESWPSRNAIPQAMGQASIRYPRHRCPIRPNPQPRRPDRRESDATTAAHCAQAPGETTATHQRRSSQTGPPHVHPAFLPVAPHRIVRAYVDYYNHSRPHQGIGQRMPARFPRTHPPSSGQIVATPMLGGLHHAYSRAAYLH